MGIRKKIFELIEIERQMQLFKWGDQSHDHYVWLAILGEEFGEASKSILEGKDLQALFEVVQCAAVSIAWLEDWLEDKPILLSECKEKLSGKK